MNELFLKIINMSISASWLILAVLILRLVLKKAPKWVNVLLWGIVAVRLAFPFSIILDYNGSGLSLMEISHNQSGYHDGYCAFCPDGSCGHQQRYQSGDRQFTCLCSGRQRKSASNLDSNFEYRLGGRCCRTSPVYRSQLLASALQSQRSGHPPG